MLCAYSWVFLFCLLLKNIDHFWFFFAWGLTENKNKCAVFLNFVLRVMKNVLLFYSSKIHKQFFLPRTCDEVSTVQSRCVMLLLFLLAECLWFSFRQGMEDMTFLRLTTGIISHVLFLISLIINFLLLRSIRLSGRVTLR